MKTPLPRFKFSAHCGLTEKQELNMTNATYNAADKAAAANTELNAARHRIAALESSEANRAAGIHRVNREIGIAIANESTANVPELRAWVAEQQAAIGAEKAERTRIQESMQGLILRAGALTRGAEMAHAHQSGTELEAARAAWAEAITPHLAAAERLRAAVKAAGMYCLIPADADLLSGGGKRPINV
jgi:hypothetical protein